ncbi:enoyl-CoA delta isomerase 1, peroxisomal [Phoenix dactylifera]|uniref:Delta(3)-Delta(2)-enoyl-CoA isomerase n=1 Tax=Phoenix dactylifera TaxID=42345 RepID=A0A8B7C203_PHODC|nr:enoyl-CoA delta isomerase 1, peroxisomal [Phoenix dactylifera]
MCTLEKRGRVYLLTLTGDGEHRLNPTLLNAIRSALARVRSDSARAGGGSALVTAAEGKYFSNGFDLAWAKSSPANRTTIMTSAFQHVVADLMTLPMPTIAAVTGHASAAGFALALIHDYVVMRRDRGFLYMSELDIEIPIAEFVMALFRSKIADPRVRRDVLLRAPKITAAEAERKGIIERAVGGAAEAVETAVRMGEELAEKNWNGEVYASIRNAAFPEVCRALELAEEGDEETKRLASKL